MNRKKTSIFLICLVLAVVMAGAVYAAVGYGSKDDPLISKSYLDEVLRPEIEAEMDKEIEAAIGEIENSETSADFVSISLNPGDKLSCTIGCELLHRSGTLVAEGVFVDTTAGAEISSGTELESNHLYIAGAEAVLGAETEAALLIKGAYILNKSS